MEVTADKEAFFVSWSLRKGRPQGLGRSMRIGTMVGDKYPGPSPDSINYLEFGVAANEAGLNVWGYSAAMALYGEYRSWYAHHEPPP